LDNVYSCFEWFGSHKLQITPFIYALCPYHEDDESPKTGDDEPKVTNREAKIQEGILSLAQKP
ncbi:hypothetical protein MEO42_22915, partial [Dolichospermum sp. ST_sed6]|nr:hypothetical protein [Dolichospermum sp. ST_sed9]MDD1433891.1 hypothetical protein [Dolichospermum sp. ST_sed6]MDD1457505.1 hypothetical protein [Dolichospermum sp. ST_sed7]MDD1467822.1 hypothetical protein [Dolichospermum sp. ST_sed5]